MKNLQKELKIDLIRYHKSSFKILKFDKNYTRNIIWIVLLFEFIQIAN